MKVFETFASKIAQEQTNKRSSRSSIHAAIAAARRGTNKYIDNIRQ
jgi:hypothetical protein